MIKLHNANTKEINYFIDEVYSHAFMKRNDLLEMFKSGIVTQSVIKNAQIVTEIFDLVWFIVSKTNSEIDLTYSNNKISVIFIDIKITLIVNIYKQPKMKGNMQSANSTVIIGKYFLLRDDRVGYHNDDYVLGNKNNNAEILKLIIYGTNNKTGSTGQSSIWDNFKREIQLLKGRYFKKA